MRFKIRNQVKIIIALLLSVVIYNEYLVYVFQSYKWPTLRCHSEDECVKILMVADPQILGEQSEDAPLKYIFNWDCDRYLAKTYAQAVSHFNPDVVLFLGDIMDEGTIATGDEFHSYLKRLSVIFNTEYPIKHVWIPGDNDIGGENEPIYPGKVKQFYGAFIQSDLINVKSVNIYKVNNIMQALPKLPSDHIVPHNKTSIVVSHMPLLLSPGRFTENVITRLRPSVIFSAHKHTALHLETTLDAMFVSKVIPITPQDNDYVLKVDFQKDTYHEFVVPTCSYRMGVPNMGYSIATIDGSGKKLEYSILWSPRRFDQLKMYLLVLCSTIVYLILLIMYKFFMATFYVMFCRKKIPRSKV